MKENNAEIQTRIYLYDLMNTAQEHGFRKDDAWELNMVSDTEKQQIQRNYHPAIVTSMFPEMMLEVYHSVKAKLNQDLNNDEQALNVQSILKGELKYLVAYNPKRPRT